MSKLSDAVKGTKAYGSHAYIEPGEYTLEVQAVRENDGHKGLSGIIEFKVIAATPESKTPVGRVVSYVEAKLNDGDKGASARSRFKSALMGITGASSEDVDEGLDSFLSKHQPLHGLKVMCQAWTKTLKADGEKFTKDFNVTSMKWLNIPEEEQPTNDELNAKRKASGLCALEEIEDKIAEDMAKEAEWAAEIARRAAVEAAAKLKKK